MCRISNNVAEFLWSPFSYRVGERSYRLSQRAQRITVAAALIFGFFTVGFGFFPVLYISSAHFRQHERYQVQYGLPYPSSWPFFGRNSSFRSVEPVPVPSHEGSFLPGHLQPVPVPVPNYGRGGYPSRDVGYSYPASTPIASQWLNTIHPNTIYPPSASPTRPVNNVGYPSRSGGESSRGIRGGPSRVLRDPYG